ncbi:MAG TPA: T9SS type A sorting domain-containing protein [Flavobacterium sp.]|nr:T9SS type A sorting domain-containing protein [Flavobacterium sp.]
MSFSCRKGTTSIHYTATTTITSLATANSTSDNFIFYPNPAKNELHISSKSGVEVQSVNIYNLLGQLVLTIGQPINVIDISNLNTGNYFLKIFSENGTSTEKFIKQ